MTDEEDKVMCPDLYVGPGLAITDQCDVDEIESMREACLTIIATVAAHGASGATIVCVARALYSVDMDALKRASDRFVSETDAELSDGFDLTTVFVETCDSECKAIENARRERSTMPVAS